jgi:hypothetical protein
MEPLKASITLSRLSKEYLMALEILIVLDPESFIYIIRITH